MSWFEVSKEGLKQLLEGKDKGFILRELVQNVWDEPGVSYCRVIIEPIEGKRSARVMVEDDAPEGFYDLTHAFTLFANTRKRKDASKRGRFNMGDKQVLSLAREARIITTSGGVRFDSDGTRHSLRQRREKGSVFEAEIPMTRDEIEEAIRAFKTFIPPNIETTINGELLANRTPLCEIETTLATEHEDAEGRYTATTRKTIIRVFDLLPGEKAMIYEMGLPIIETGDRWHYDIGQRVPMTADRDNVRPAFLRDVRAEVANRMVEQIPMEEASESWVREATQDERISSSAFDSIQAKRWGEKRCVADPFDPQSRERAIANGYTIVPPRALSGDEWKNAREFGSIPSSSSLFPTLEVEGQDVPDSELTDDHQAFIRLVKKVSKISLGFEVSVSMIRSPKATTSADYGSRTVRFNLSKLNKSWFNPGNKEAHLRLIIHELGHEFGHHLTEEYYNGLARIGARLALADRKELE